MGRHKGRRLFRCTVHLTHQISTVGNTEKLLGRIGAVHILFLQRRTEEGMGMVKDHAGTAEGLCHGGQCLVQHAEIVHQQHHRVRLIGNIPSQQILADVIPRHLGAGMFDGSNGGGAVIVRQANPFGPELLQKADQRCLHRIEAHQRRLIGCKPLFTGIQLQRKKSAVLLLRSRHPVLPLSSYRVQ